MTGLILSCLLLVGQARLEVAGAVEQKLVLGEAELQAMPRHSLTVKVDGKDVKYEGVWLHELMQKAELKTRPVFGYVVARAEDNYRAVFSLAELDAAFTDLRVLVADRADGEKLPAGVGPLRLVVGHDKKAARWVKRLVRIEVEIVEN